MPLYQQLEEQFVRLLKSGQILAGDTLPAERQLADLLGVSRGTVQQCYNALRENGLIRGHGRHGSIVQGETPKMLSGIDRLRGFTEEVEQLGRIPSTQVLESEIVTDRSIASLFALPSEARFLKLVRVRRANGVPQSLESAWFSLHKTPRLAEADGTLSMYRQLAELGLPLAYCDQTMEAVMPTAEEAEAFRFVAPIPCLLLKRKSYLKDGTMLEYVEGVFRGDTYTYRMRMEA